MKYHCPIPGSVNMNSVIIAPVMMPGTDRAITVTIGGSVLLNACLYNMVRSLNPLALAVTI